jgi:hypothetical protein
MGALGLNVLERFTTVEAAANRSSSLVPFRPISGGWMKTHSVFVSLSTFWLGCRGNRKESCSNKLLLVPYYYLKMKMTIFMFGCALVKKCYI